jgi:hypothetical protein
MVISAVVAFALIFRYIELGPAKLIPAVLPALVCALLMYGVLVIYREAVSLHIGPVATLLTMVVLGVGAYVAFSLAFNRALVAEFWGTVRGVLRSV